MPNEIVVLSQAGCNPCIRVKRMLDEILATSPGIHLREVPFSSPEGLSLATTHSVLFPPAVFVEGHLVAKGRIHEQELRDAVRACVGDRAK